LATGACFNLKLADALLIIIQSRLETRGTARQIKSWVNIIHDNFNSVLGLQAVSVKILEELLYFIGIWAVTLCSAIAEEFAPKTVSRVGAAVFVSGK
jgi:hypothetical protein